MKQDPDALIASAKRALWIKRDLKNMGISVNGWVMENFERPDAKEWSRIVNLAITSKAAVIVITDDGKDGQ